MAQGRNVEPAVYLLNDVFIIVSFTMKYSMGKIKKQNIIEAIRRENI